MLRRILIAVSAIALTAAGQEPATMTMTRPFTAAQRQTLVKMVPSARHALDGVMLDLPSARFRTVRAVDRSKSGGGLAFCGWVNGKNRMGAYAGWTRFVAVGGSPGVAEVEGGGGSTVLVGLVCDDPEAYVDARDYADAFAGR